jgi:hypothetical protein
VSARGDLCTAVTSRCAVIERHYSDPDFGFPYGDARLDFTDSLCVSQAGGGAIVARLYHTGMTWRARPPREPNLCGDHGREGAKVGSPAGDIAMPGFAGSHSDTEIAAVSNYLIAHFGEKTGAVTAADVRSAR